MNIKADELFTYLKIFYSDPVFSSDRRSVVGRCVMTGQLMSFTLVGARRRAIAIKACAEKLKKVSNV